MKSEIICFCPWQNKEAYMAQLSKMQQKKALQNIATKVGIGVDNIYAVSSSEKTGKREILDRIAQILENVQ